MEYWEFLLQKQGERTWQKIYKPSLEIEEGKYRVVSHSSRNNCDVEIRVTHLDTEAVPPKRRISKRSRRTNSQGLMVVIPYTYLKPGVWEFRCCGDIMSDLLGETWQEIVKLDILPSTNRESLPSDPAIARESKTEEIENRQISPSTTVSSLRDTPIKLSEAPEINAEEELSLFPPQPVTFVAENSPSLTEIETETSLEKKVISSAIANSKTAEILSPDSIASEELLKNAELDLDETSTNVETSYNNRSLHKEENSPGEISISSPSIEEKNSVNSVNESDFFWEETNSDDPEILTSETDSAKELSWLNDFEEMRTNDLESVTSEESTNSEINSENELSWLSEIESND
ncbi:MAG: hypothetical protein SAL07_22115, partial [Oscillatoria sp. PMC 1051.18]|nr:hypothetical protein [Oscillatoria sp. PMC 1050.18]MEC5032605.1 hypothetical protein [Oscillatoria sp. PMC 1051.18]